MSNRKHYYPHSLSLQEVSLSPRSHRDLHTHHWLLFFLYSLPLRRENTHWSKHSFNFSRISVLYLYFLTLNSFKLIFLFVVSCPGRQMTNLFQRENLPTRLLCHFLRFNTSPVTSSTCLILSYLNKMTHIPLRERWCFKRMLHWQPNRLNDSSRKHRFI